MKPNNIDIIIKKVSNNANMTKDCCQAYLTMIFSESIIINGLKKFAKIFLQQA